MMAFMEFAQSKCEYAVLECGIGGHLDSTNIIDTPVCSAITSIGLDHIDIIGDTLHHISSEKAGVIKAGRPCVLGPTCIGEEPISNYANQMGSELIQIEDNSCYEEINNNISAQIMLKIFQEERMPVS